MADFRAELAALVAAYDRHGGWRLQADEEALLRAVERARAVLAQPETASAVEAAIAAGQPVTLPSGTVIADPAWFESLITIRAADLLERQAAAAAVAADGEVAELVVALRVMAVEADRDCRFSDADVITRSADLLERQALRPIPVSEELPGPKDCVPHPRTKRGNWCWGFERCDVSLARPARWRLMHMEAVEMEASHWLAAHALPLPEVE